MTGTYVKVVVFIKAIPAPAARYGVKSHGFPCVEKGKKLNSNWSAHSLTVPENEAARAV